MRGMPSPARRILSIALLLAAAALILIVTERAIALVERLAGLPPVGRWSVGAVVAVLAGTMAWYGWRWWRPRLRSRKPRIDRADLDRRIGTLDELGADTGDLQDELRELDRRRAEGQLYVAVFGEISSGKSSLIASLASAVTTGRDVLGGTTREVTHHAGQLADDRPVIFADVPGSREVGGDAREAMAREEALRAHVVLYVCGGDLTRQQAGELDWLAAFGKPMLLVLNKADHYRADELDALRQRLDERYGDVVDAVIATRAGGSERFERRLADGRTEYVQRERLADVAELQRALVRSTAAGAAGLEPAREHAVLGGLDERAAEREQAAREQHSTRIVARYTRRAAIGALAAVVPGSDLVIQGALATTLARELARLYDARVSDLEIDAFLKQARLTLRTSASIVLAIAGNALKAFPGLGTLGGGVLHAFAYALIFDSLGRALARSFAEHRALDQRAAGDALRDLLGDASRERLSRLATLTGEALRNREP